MTIHNIDVDIFGPRDLDDADLKAIIAVQLADLEDALTHGDPKGKRKLGTASPTMTAMLSYREYLESAETIIADNKLAQSIDRALNEDAELLSQVMAEEQLAQMDRRIALSLSEPQDDDDSGSVFSLGSFEDFLPDLDKEEMGVQFLVENQARAGAPGANPRLGLGYATGSGTSGAPETKDSTASLVRETICCSCMDTKYCVTAPCGDTYCHICIKQLFTNASADEELFPPRCHRQELPLYIAQPFLSKEEIANFKAKSVEFTTRNRVYCFNCTSFIPTTDTEEDCALCNTCGLTTCLICKQKWHGKSDCPADKELDAVLELAAQEDWRRCRSCHAVVERSFGCQHITCRCGNEFCYRCGLQWKTCACDDWDHRALHQRAEELAIRDVGTDALPSRIAHRIREIRDDLQERHRCVHTGTWIRDNNPRQQCEMCFDTLGQFIWVCGGCRLLACTRCRMNRV